MIKYCTILARILTQLLLYSALKTQPSPFLSLCELTPTQAPINTNFFLRLIFIAFTPHICRFYRKTLSIGGFFGEVLALGEKYLTVRMMLLLLTKILTGTIYGEIEIWYILKNSLLEMLLLAVCLGIDTFSFFSCEVAEIIFVDPFLLMITINETFESFCFRYSLLHIDLNLLTLCISAVEGFAFFSNKVNTVYTKQDAYRLMMTTILFGVVYGFSSVGNFELKYGLSWAFSFPLMVLAMRRFKDNKFKESLWWMSGMMGVMLSTRLGLELWSGSGPMMALPVT